MIGQNRPDVPASSSASQHEVHASDRSEQTLGTLLDGKGFGLGSWSSGVGWVK